VEHPLLGRGWISVDKNPDWLENAQDGGFRVRCGDVWVVIAPLCGCHPSEPGFSHRSKTGVPRQFNIRVFPL